MWNIVGHEDATRLLGRALETGRLAHAYLLVGPAHVGKTTLALDLAAAVNCIGDAPPCGACPQCRRVLERRHADIVTLGVEEGAGRKTIGIDAVRDAAHQVHLKPFEGALRVTIVSGAEFLSDGAANAMLKLLEEPPPQLLLVLLSEDAESVVPTVRSRCQRLDLRALPDAVVAEALVERWGAPPDEARTLARLAHGRLGWAVEALEDPSSLETRARRMERLQGMVGAGLRERFAYAAELAGLLPQQRTAVRETLDLWAAWWHDRLVVEEGVPGAATLELDPESPAGRSPAASGTFSFTREEMVRALRAVFRAEELLELNANPRLVLEELMLTLPAATGGSGQP